MESFEKWVKANRPSGIGRHSEKGRRKENSWFRKLDNLAIMRLLHHAPLSEWEKAFPDAWKRYGPKVRKMDLEDYADSKNRELYKRRQSALDDFHALFPFLPASEHPVSWETKAKR